MPFKFSFFVAITVAVVFAFSCSQNKIIQKPLTEPPKKITRKQTNSNELQLTFHGENEQASFSPSGDFVAYISKNRYQHTNPQVYQINLDTLQSVRVTYQDGQANSPIYSDNGKSIIYSSTTDEIKENPLFIYNRLHAMNQVTDRGVASVKAHSGSDLQPFELYKKNLITDNFLRLTKSPYLDKNPSVFSFRNQMLFTSVRDGNLEIYSYRPGLPNSPIRFTFSDLMDDEAQYSPSSREYVWVRYGQNSKYSQIMFGNRLSLEKKEISFGNNFHINPKWHPNGEYIYFSATGPNHKNYQLYTMKKDGSCKTRLTFNDDSDTQPAIDPNSKYVVFTRNKNLFKLNLKEPKCSET